MAEFPALPLWTGELLSDTMDLTAAEFGAYVRLLIVAWRRPDCDLPDDDDFLRRSSGTTKNWRRIRAKIMPRFFDLRDARFTQKRLLKERDWVATKVRYASAAGRANSLKRLNGHSTAVAGANQRNEFAQRSTYTYTHKKEVANWIFKRDAPQFQAWLEYAETTKGQKLLAKELHERISEDRAFNFVTEWPPDHRHIAIS